MQAMNFFAAFLLLLMPEENAFWYVERLGWKIPCKSSIHCSVKFFKVTEQSIFCCLNMIIFVIPLFACFIVLFIWWEFSVFNSFLKLSTWFVLYSSKLSYLLQDFEGHYWWVFWWLFLGGNDWISGNNLHYSFYSLLIDFYCLFLLNEIVKVVDGNNYYFDLSW